ncbi:hypothetical protein NW767_014004 [Fusarium falciforme]|nr:hypothetical protein NW767_014004 [Fusarium falciforme]
MLACATRLSTSKSVRTMGPKYYELAKAETAKAMSDPTPANMQGFLLLSEYEVTKGNDRPGWMFCGVACRMLSDLGLHELASTVDTARVSKQESDLAYALLAACIIYEGVWTLYLGRPSSIPRSVMSIAASRCKAGRQSDSSWVNAWVGLCVPMAEISQVLNDQSITDSHRIALLRQLSKDVEEWHDSLPPELTYIENRLVGMDPAGYGLHTQFCKVQILVKQALSIHPSSRKRRHSQMASNEDPQTSSDDSQAIIFQYAHRTARLLVTYREAFGMEKIPSIMLDNAVVAATVMIQYLDREDTPAATQQQTVWLRQLVRSLELVQPHFPIVGRMIDSLRNIRGHDVASGVLGSALDTTAATRSEPQPGSRRPSDLTTGPSAESSNIYNTDMGWESFDLDHALNDFAAGKFDDPTLVFSLSETFMANFTQIPPLN